MMLIREELIELMDDAEEYAHNLCGNTKCDDCRYDNCEGDCWQAARADRLIANGVTVQECARPLEEWGEDYGDVLWWKFPIEEPPYVGSPLDESWPAYHTHWTPIAIPQPPKGE